MKTTKQLKAELDDLVNRVESIHSSAQRAGRDLTSQEKTEIDAILDSQAPSLRSDLDRALKLETEQKIRAGVAVNAVAGERLGADGDTHVSSPTRTAFKNKSDAYAAGQFILGTLLGNEHAMRWCREHDIMAAMTTSDNTKAGFLVPAPMENAIIELREQYGVFRRNMTQWPMPIAGSIEVPKLNSELTCYYVGENTAPSASDVSLGQVKLEARKLATFCGPISSELNEDAAISVAEMLTRSIAQKFAIAEDQAGFNGDGTSTYGGIVGLKTALDANSKSTAAANHNTIIELTVADYIACMGLQKQYPGNQNKWYTNSFVYYNSMLALQMAAGGAQVSDIQNGGKPMFLGAPVEFTQVLPNTDTNSQIVAYYGDLNMACCMGTRRGLTVKISDQVYFSSDALAVMATERYSIVVHDGTTAALGGSAAAGAVIALVTAAS